MMSPEHDLWLKERVRAETAEADRDKALSQVKVLREALERIQLCSSSNHDLALEIARNALASIQ